MKLFASLTVLAGLSGIASADLFEVSINGRVEFNISNPSNPNTNPDILAIRPGHLLSYTFTVDSDAFVGHPTFGIRAYEIDPASFAVTTNQGFSAGMSYPLPGGSTPYFVVRDNDPAVDGFYITWGGIELPFGLPITESGLFGDPFEAAFSVGYTGNTLSSLDIAGAAGTYGYGNGGPGTLTSFYFNLVDLGFEVVGIEFTDMTITRVPAPGTLVVAAFGFVASRRRR
ncbi:MAG: hypothetical protein KIT19_03350 [Phycisphaeraceae bacterium]|nr:hypothetical protein [Phycisphaeraceae bacterium]